MRARAPLEGVCLPKCQNECGIYNVSKAGRESTGRIRPVKKKVTRAVVAQSEGDSFRYRVFTRAHQGGGGVRHGSQQDKTGYNAALDHLTVALIFHGFERLLLRWVQRLSRL